MTEVSPEPGEMAAELAALVGRMRRALRTQVRHGMPEEPLPHAQVELLLTVATSPGLRVTDAAARLGLAPNTVSTLVSNLTSAGLLARRADPHDRRGARLEPTARGRARIERWRRARQTAMAMALGALDAVDGAAVASALPALARLTEGLERRVTPAGVGPRG